MFKLPANDEYFSEQETVDLLRSALGARFSLATLRGTRRGGKIGYAKMGRFILHSGKHIRTYIRSCETQTAQDSPPTNSTGSANDPDQSSGTEPGSIPESARRAAQASALKTFEPQGKRSRSGGRKIAA